MKLHCLYRDGLNSTIEVPDDAAPTFRSGLCSLWLMHHTVVMVGGLEQGAPNAWDEASGRPTKDDMARIRRVFGAEAAKAVEQKLLMGPA